MLTLVVFEFPYNGPWGTDMTAAMQGLARDIAQEEGLAWKVWTEAQERGTAGGIYLFKDKQAAQRYIKKHTTRLAEFGITGVDSRIFDVNADLTALDHGSSSVLPA